MARTPATPSAKKTEEKPTPAPEKKGVNKVEKMPVASLDALLLDSAKDQTSDFDQRDLTVPRIKLLQALSPELTKNDPAFIKEARPGDILLPDRTLIQGDDGVVFIPVAYKREGLVFKPKRGGFVANLGQDYADVLATCTKGPDGEDMTPEGNELIETATYFGFVINDGQPQPCVMSMNKSQWKSAKKINTLISQYREKSSNGTLICPPIFWRAWKFTTDATSNDKGNWFIWTMAPEARTAELENGPELFEACKRFREEVMSGAKQARHEDAD